MVTTPSEDGPKVVERRYRIVLDVTVHATEITAESAADYFAPGRAGEGLGWEWAERQNRLLRVLLDDEEIAGPFFLEVVKDDLGALLKSDLIGGFPEGRDDGLFEKAYSRMEDEDVEFFREAQEGGFLSDNLELVYRAFVTDWEGAQLVEVRLITEEDGGGSG